VVGDDDQSIYGFQGADVGAFHNFRLVWRQAALAVLSRNYRSSVQVVESSGAVIAASTSRVAGKSCTSERGAGPPVTLVECRTPETEVQYVLSEITRLHDGAGDGEALPFSDMAILCRTNKLALQYAQCLRRLGVPYARAGSNVFKLGEMRKFLAYARLVAHEADEDALMVLHSALGIKLTPATTDYLERLREQGPAAGLTAEEAELLMMIDAPGEDVVVGGAGQPATAAAGGAAAGSAAAPAPAPYCAPFTGATSQPPLAAVRQLLREHVASLAAKTAAGAAGGKPASRKRRGGSAGSAAGPRAKKQAVGSGRLAAQHPGAMDIDADDITDSSDEGSRGAAGGTGSASRAAPGAAGPCLANVPVGDIRALAKVIEDVRARGRR
jgi:hypothetical protein